ncbi:Superfamily II DNA or RNA helicase [Prevotella sp. khp1]|uniref:Eco57I restriction-modification methylase domain-containing protein n=1 Tax=Prevotellaceae TaxID=171552 RepID=UPI00088DA317|nr:MULTISPECIES: Eco57I restriction-modification methylase domain-containing protein [Prevotellaceae]QVJ81013.1 Eco57I restriction-modification methylase domain-containing protein [Xylanibacter ruminicola]SDQ09297.1 Superfamily II DNA or RNA helicase [Prevotella sp. khp1]
MATFESSLKPRLIYIFAINDEWHKDCLKIGETTLDEDGGDFVAPNDPLLQQAARNRIDQYTKTAGIAYQLLYTELTIYFSGGKVCSFNDKQVHTVLERSGIKKKTFDTVKGANEWYCCDLETAKKAIKAVKDGMSSLKPGDITQEQTPIVFRPEQSKAIEMTIKQFGRSNQMLWNAKMRFGKTLSALEVVKRQGYQRTLILTHRPVVDEGWFEDFKKIFYDHNDYHYGSKNKGEQYDKLEKLAAKGDSYVYFASMQDLRGSDLVGGKFEKNSQIFNTLWNLLIVDEAHEGTQTELGKNVVSELVKADTKVLRLSGTPFNLLDDYSENEIFTWDYVMEQRAKNEWDLTHFGDHNPYESLPAINIYTYDLGTLLSEYIEDEKAFNFREFFRTKDNGTLVHEKDVDRFLDLLCKDDNESLYPYSCDKFRRIFRHTLWVVPGVKAARALSAKLKAHPVFSLFQVVNVAGNGDEDEENAEALQMVDKAIGPDSDLTYTITLSCGRLTTGVSIKPWTAVFMMAGSFSTSAAQYMQTIFRVQTPYTHNGRMKEQCYAFDFAPDRTLRVLAETAKVSAKAGKQSDEDRKILGDFLNFCPIISIDGSQMKPYDVNKMMSQLKKAQIEKVVQGGFEDFALYNDELLKLTDVELHDFDELKKIIGATKAMGKTGDIDINNQGFTNEQYEEKERLEKKPKKERTPEEQAKLDELKAMNNQRRNAISILRGISIRMPLLIYGAELTNEDEEITIDNFASLIDDQSWEEFMPKGVDKKKFEKFKRYYEPDVFREAGKRIREMARAADKFTIEERIERIATIFNTFRNPDKETVLTPWRVVNMHMSDCLGGWCFYDESFKQMLATPRYVDQEKVTADVFRTDSHILEINSKSGLYPLYIAYNIYRCRVEEAKKKYGEVGIGFSKSLWDATIEENILVVCKTPMAKSITKRTLAGFRDTKVNAQYYPNLIENISERPEAVVNTFRDGKHFWHINENQNMKLDAIVGNPPYQVMDGGAGVSAIPVYNKFVDFAKKINPHYISMIMPAKWYNAGRGLEQFRYEMLNDKCISKLYDYIDPHDCFPTVDVAGGVCYFLRDNKYNGLCKFVSCKSGSQIPHMRDLSESEILIRHQEEISILSKVLIEGQTYLNEIAYSQKPFGLRTYVKPMEKGNILLRYNGGIGPYDRDCITVNKDLIDCWKIVTSCLTAEHAGETDKNGQKRIFATLEMLEPGTICTETYMMLCTYKSKTVCANVLKYLKTRFVRALIAMATSTQHMSKANFRFVPLQDFTKSWTDEELYKKYNLTDDEIKFIESMIKPM